MWVTAGSSLTGMLWGRCQGECIRESSGSSWAPYREAFLGTRRGRDAAGEQQCFFTLALVRNPAGGSLLLLGVERNTVQVAGRERSRRIKRLEQ